ncbi:ABC transporter substrate-binding protein [Globicatella sulfidifaciens]|uniref:ABC transporter substrate-binding protein n=1 Tax=Globicatella sulfidifaciens TaxID=136093 RepID=A0A7X8C2T3_9LACT|nr:ABC transporter substrate-binding protein [Globicatella sulfidifaciens]NLJ17913.1 ABC transporter substrate-binding protein [Globicatella sulfidifaciens]
MKKLVVSVLSLLMALTVLPWMPQSVQAEEMMDLSLMLDWYPNANHVPIYVAIKEGYFEEEGLNLTINMPAEADDPIKLAGAGQTDIAVSYPAVLMQAVAEGIPAKAIGSLVQQRLDAVMYKKESGITTPKDLEGKKVGYSATTISENIIEAMMEHDGASYDKAEMVNVGWDLIPALATDKVDALIGAYTNHELLMLQKEGYDVDYFDFTEFGVPDSDELIFVAGNDTIEAKKPELQAFMRALKKGFDKALEDPEAAIETIFENEDNAYVLDKEIEIQSWNLLQDYMVSKGDFGNLVVDDYVAFAKFLADKGSIAKELTAEELVEDLSK